jgi:hypothetical protein
MSEYNPLDYFVRTTLANLGNYRNNHPRKVVVFGHAVAAVREVTYEEESYTKVILISGEEMTLDIHFERFCAEMIGTEIPPEGAYARREPSFRNGPTRYSQFEEDATGATNALRVPGE